MTYEELVVTAAVGTAQRPVPDTLLDTRPGSRPSSPEGTPPAVRLLDAAAAYAAVRRATLPAAPRDPAPEPAPADPAGEPPQRFATALARQVGQLAGVPGDTEAAVVTETVAEALGWLSAAGWRLPHRLLVPLLQRAARDPRIAAAVRQPLGARGRWLAGQNPAWDRALEQMPEPDAEPERAWHEGTPAQRRLALTRLRAADPDSARELLQESWASEPVDDRVAYVQVIARTATPPDEEFLTTALADRSSRVADAARPGLLLIPGSALLERLRARARTAVVVRRGPFGHHVDLVPPDDDPQARVDGLDTGGYSPTPAENRLNALVAQIPPADWPVLAGIPAGDLLGAKTDKSWSVAGGLVAAAARWGDEALACRLVDAGLRSAELFRLVDEARLVRLLGAAPPCDPATVAVLTEAAATPWPTGFAGALGGWLQRTAVSGRRGAAAVPPVIWNRAATAVPVEVARGWAGRLRSLADDPGVSAADARRIRGSAAVLTLRAAMYDDVRAAVARRDPTCQEDR